MALFTVLEAIVFIVISRNFSERNLAIASAEAAQSASRAKSQFLSRMSHEIRTPINAIIGLDSIALRHEDISPRTREELNKIGYSARHLLSIINDILDMSRIESGKMTLNEAEFSFEDFLEEVNVIMNGQRDDKGLRYVCSKEGALDARFVGDSLKLKQVVINILGNAVKFTDPPGEVFFGIAQTNLDEDRAMLRLTMKDSGIGMDKEFIPKLFEAFSQEDMGNTTRFGGSGLGMAITKSIVEMMGGEIKVDSEKASARHLQSQSG
jgi:signal transduction histidine kinase